jgi:ABC-type transport system involved in multi-copper enzyme maturation permease subunit
MRTTLPGASPTFAPQSADKSRDGLLLRVWFLMESTCRRLWATVWCEFLLQVRSAVFWAMLAVLVLLTGLHAWGQVSNAAMYISPGSAAIEIESYLGSFLLFLLPFLHANIFARDRFRNTGPLVWSRPLALWEYATGKGLGAIAASLALTWAPLGAGWLTVSIARASLQPLEMWIWIALLLGAMVVLITCVALLFIAVTSPFGLLGALFVALPITYLNLTSAKSMLWLHNITGQTLFVSTSIGFGPDGTLLFWQRLSYLAIGLVCLCLMILFVQFRERRGIVHWYHLICTLVLLLLFASSALNCITTFQTIGASYTDTGMLTLTPVQATTSSYILDVHVDPGTGQVHGTASFLLTPRAPTLSSFVVELNPGLYVRQISGQDPVSGKDLALPFTQISAGWTRIDTSHTSIATGQAWHLSIQYDGTMLYSRDDYAQPKGGFGFQHAENASWSTNYWYLSYLGQGAGVLLGAAGSWYPLPYTKQALQTGTRISIDQIQVRFPGTYKVWSGLAQGKWSSQGKQQIFAAQPHRSLPVAFLVALEHPQENALNIWFQGSAPDSVQLLADQYLIQEDKTLISWLRPGGETSLQAIVVPILPFPVVGDHLLLLPENDFTTPYSQYTFLNYSNQTIARKMANRLAINWWLNTDYFSFTSVHGESDTQNSSDSTSLQPQNALLDTLGEYSAAVITDQALGGNFYSQEMDVCSKLNDLNMAGTSQTDPVYQSVAQKAQLLGTDCDSLELVPYKIALTKGVGFAGLTRLLQQYAQDHAQQPTDMRQFLQDASKLAGTDITRQTAPYICPAYNTKIAQDSANPLACLDTEYSGT